MNYNNKKLGEELNQQLDIGYDVTRISRWAFRIFSHTRFLDSSTEEILEYLFRMEDDPQFEYSEKELRWLAELLINEEENPLIKVNEMKTKENS